MTASGFEFKRLATTVILNYSLFYLKQLSPRSISESVYAVYAVYAVYTVYAVYAVYAVCGLFAAVVYSCFSFLSGSLL